MSNNTNSDDAKEELRVSGASSYDDLFVDVPETFLPSQPASDPIASLRNRAASTSAEDGPVYLGAGFYDHDVPSSVDRLVSQIEFSQTSASGRSELCDELGDAVYSFQNLARRLTGMESANVSLYRRGDALTHACMLAVEASGRKLIVVPETLSPLSLANLKSSSRTDGVELRIVPSVNGVADVDALRKTLAEEGSRVAATIVPYPNFYGCLERVGQISEAARSVGAFVVMAVDPVALALLRSPADWGADLVAGDVHTTPVHAEDGRVRLGFVAASRGFLATAPEKLVNCTVDSTGDLAYFLSRAFVRVEGTKGAEKKRERARGALRTLVHLAHTDFRDLRKIANESRLVALYAHEELEKAGFEFCFTAPYLREFAVKVEDPAGLLKRLEKWGIVGGYALDDGLLLAFTEKRRNEEVDELVYFMKDYRDEKRKKNV